MAAVSFHTMRKFCAVDHDKVPEASEHIQLEQLAPLRLALVSCSCSQNYDGCLRHTHLDLFRGHGGAAVPTPDRRSLQDVFKRVVARRQA